MKVRIVRSSEPTGFTQVPNAALRDERLSYKARGIHANLLSNSDDGWIESADTLADKSPDGRHSVRTGLQELVRHGYVEYRKAQGSDGKWSTEMIVHTSPKSENPTPVRPAKTSAKAQVAPKSENLTSDRSQETRPRSDQQKDASSQVAPEAGYPTSENLTLYRTPLQNTKQKTRERRARAADRPGSTAPAPRPDGLTSIPDDFAPTDSMRRWALGTFGERLDLNFETAQFVSHYRSTGVRRKSWPDAWQKWVRDSDQRATQRGPARSPQGIKPSTTDQRVAQAQALKAKFRDQGPTVIRGEIAR